MHPTLTDLDWARLFQHADLHGLLRSAAADLGANIRTSCTVTEVDPDDEEPHVVLANGEVVKGDVIIGADGLSGLSREIIIGDREHQVYLDSMMYK